MPLLKKEEKKKEKKVGKKKLEKLKLLLHKLDQMPP